MYEWRLDPEDTLVILHIPRQASSYRARSTEATASLSRQVRDLLKHLREREGYDLRLQEDVLVQDEQQHVWCVLTRMPNIETFLAANVSLGVLADPRWRHITWRVIPAGTRLTLRHSVTYQRRDEERFSAQTYIGDVTVTFHPHPTPALLLAGTLTETITQYRQQLQPPILYWDSSPIRQHYEQQMFGAFKRWALLGVPSGPVVGISASIDHIVVHVGNASAYAFAQAFRAACMALLMDGLLIPCPLGVS